MSHTALTSKLSNKLIVNMYTKKPIIDENGNMVFKKSGLILFCGLILTFIFSLCAVFMDYYVNEIMYENSIDINMKGTLSILGYGLTILFILIGIRCIIIFRKHKILISRDEITSIKIFSSETIKICDLETIQFSNSKGLVFKSRYSKISFGNFTIGLVELLKFIEENISKDKYESAMTKAKKMLRRNRISI